MRCSLIPGLPVLAAWVGLLAILGAAPRDAEWAAVADAVTKRQPQTAVRLLKPLETSAFADHAWGEGAKALVMRVRLENKVWFKEDPFGRPPKEQQSRRRRWQPPVRDPFYDPKARKDAADDSDPFAPEDGAWEDIEVADPFAPDQGEAKVDEDADPFAEPEEETSAAPDSESAKIGGLLGCVRQLAREVAGLPEPVRAVARLFEARWLTEYAWDSRSDLLSRTSVKLQDEDDREDMEVWDADRIENKIRELRRQVLDARESTATCPAAEWSVLFRPGQLGDAYRPTLHDLLAHAMLEDLDRVRDHCLRPWYLDESPVRVESPVFDDAEAFIAWQPDWAREHPDLRQMLANYQELLAFHRDDADPTAFLHCNLERLRWAGSVAGGRHKEKIHAAAIRRFIADNAAHPLSADARVDDAILCLRANQAVKSHGGLLESAAAFPDHPFGAMCRDFADHMEKPWLRAATASTWPPSGGSVSVVQKNMGHLWFRLYPIDWQPAEAVMRTAPCVPQNVRELVEQCKAPPALAWDRELTAPRDFGSHQHDLATPRDIYPGTYLLVIAGDREFSVPEQGLWWNWVTVSTIGLVTGTEPADGEHITGRTVDAVTGEPLKGLRVECWQGPVNDGDPVHREATTTRDGAFRLAPDGDPRRRMLVVAEANGQRTFSWLKLDKKREVPEPTRSVSVFTDRAIYRPGQEIRFKGIVTENCAATDLHRTVNSRKVKVALSAPAGQDCGELNLTTNDFGSFSGSFPVPKHGMLGRYSLEVDGRWGANVQIEEYRRTSFTVKLDPPGKPVQYGDTMSIKGRAVTLTGSPVAGAKVEWRLYRESWFTGWTGWRLQYADSLELLAILEGETTSDSDGGFTVAFPAEAEEAFDPLLEPVSTYCVHAEVTDDKGERHDAVVRASAAFFNLAPEISLPGWNEAGKPIPITIGTASFDGQALAAVGVLRIHRLQEPAECPWISEDLFYEGRDRLYDAPLLAPESWELGEVVRELPVKTTAAREGGNCAAELTVRLPAGYYRTVCEVDGESGHQAVAIQDLQVIDPEARRFGTKLPFVLLRPKGDHAPGKPCRLFWGTGLPSARACVEWFAGRTLLHREWSLPGRTQQVFTFTPEPTQEGLVVARIVQVGGNRFFQDWIRFSEFRAGIDLDLAWEHVSSKLEPGGKDTWSVVIRDSQGRPARAEMVATLYDASLDDLRRHSLSPGYFGHGLSGYGRSYYVGSTLYGDAEDGKFTIEEPSGSYGSLENAWCTIKRPYRTMARGLDDSRHFIGTCVNHWGRGWIEVDDWTEIWLYMHAFQFYEPPELPKASDALMGRARAQAEEASAGDVRRKLDAIVARRDLRETAFFHPHLTTDEDGVVNMSFTMPEGVGKWRFLAFAHDAELRRGSLEGSMVTTKDLMVRPNPPRFLREGDTLEFPVRIENLSDRTQSGSARLVLTDETDGRDLATDLGVTTSDLAFDVAAGQSQTVAWTLRVPVGCGPVRYKALATSGSLSDGEEGCLPVLPRKIAVTDSLALRIRGEGEKRSVFQALKDSGRSDTLRHESLQVQVVSQPVWQALLALPSLIEFPHECAEQTFHRYYASALAASLLESDPRIGEVLRKWRDTGVPVSPLQRNQELAGILLEETPWLRDALGETQQRRHLAELFDRDRLAAEQDESWDKLQKLQCEDGLWPWFAGGDGSEHVTVCIVTGAGRMRGFMPDESDAPWDSWAMSRAVHALDGTLTNRWKSLRWRTAKEPGLMEQNHLDPAVAAALYARSFFRGDEGVKVNDADRAAHDYFIGQAKRFWPTLDSRMAAAQVALALWREGDRHTPKLVTRSLRERASRNDEAGMWWAEPKTDAWRWWQAPVETQAMMIEAFGEIDRDVRAVDDCRAWLIHQKRVRSWSTTIGTANAIHAILAPFPGADDDSPLTRKGIGQMLSDTPLGVALGGRTLDPGNVEPGCGFYQVRLPAAEVHPALADIVLTRKDPGVAWASVHWQYFEDMAKLKSHATAGLRLQKRLFVRRTEPGGQQVLEPLAGPLHVGDELVSRIVLKNDNALDFVHLKDARASGAEPLVTLSGRRWQGGMAFYQETRDTATHMFFDTLPPGTHVLETGMRVTRAGAFQSGVAEVRCMYAPEFQSRSGSVEIKVEK